jgi:hypothetical protein
MLVDYRAIPEIKERIEFVENNADANERIKGHPFLYDPGKELLLHVKVTDPVLAQVFLYESLGPNKPYPGLEVLEVRWGDLDHKKKVMEYLEDRVMELKEEIGDYSPPRY